MLKKRLVILCLTIIFTLCGACSALAAFERGDEGQEVVAIQKRLVELRYTITDIDGKFGGETEAAIKKFQSDNKLEADGIVGAMTYKALMNKEMPPNRSMDVVKRILRSAYSVIGSPYVFGGTSPYGFDCSGFTRYAFAKGGVSIPRTADAQMEYGRIINDISRLRPGDLLFYTTYAPGASHCGIYIGNGNFIHAGCSTGVTIAPAFTGYWGARYYGACRILKS